MVSWNYRVFREEGGDHVVREVFYDDQGAILGCTANGVEPWGESLEALIGDIEAFKAATLLPVLTLADVPVDGKKQDRQRNRSRNLSHDQLLARLGISPLSQSA